MISGSLIGINIEDLESMGLEEVDFRKRMPKISILNF